MQDFDNSVDRLSTLFGESLATHEIDVTHPYRLRLDILFFRLRLIALEENLRMVTSLGNGSKLSQHSAIMGDLIQHTTALEAKERLLRLQPVITECGSKNLSRLEAEARLVQVCFHIILRGPGANHVLEVDDCLERIFDLCQTYPDTAGQLFDSYKTVKAVVKGTRYKTNMYTEGARNVWWRMPPYRVGNLAHCCNGHPYSSLTGNGCPECGRKVSQFPKTKAMDPNTYLKEKEFMAAMKVASSIGSCHRWRSAKEVS